MASWDYAANGPATWAKSFPAAAGQKQSPIDINPGSAAKESVGALSASYKAGNNTLTNTGLSFAVSIDGSLSGGPLGAEFKAASFHFHWDKSSSAGSEHTVGGKSYASEVHIVHYNASKFSSVADAAKADGGLAVLAIFVQAGGANAEVQKLVDLLPSCGSNGSSAAVPGGFNASALLPGDKASYWYYPGSLTTPPCSESVTWIVYKDAISMSEAQLAAFRKITPSNYRPVQSLGGRKVCCSF
ncbi:hypothetical protein NP493_389g01003 [Ridgeia piscesae]|uniref:Carbonic anhydrase n=1 Tax=Ridgeia piscesae TaxID=27915 RepID=A0AAD9L2K5_RIDPI|nr:hypothetical protein NP493_389g01003 [Ridgeia piscesae]